MVVDASIIVAIALLEPEWHLAASKVQAGQPIIASPTLLESYTVLRPRLGEDAESALDTILRSLRIEVVPFGENHVREAFRAFDRFGKGHHPAALNLGDCISYALSKLSGQPLLFLGNDFGQTDISVA